MVEFSRIEQGYMVLIDGDYRGRVEKLDSWTIRGSSMSWVAKTRNGLYVGSEKTRKAAALLLKPKEASK